MPTTPTGRPTAMSGLGPLPERCTGKDARHLEGRPPAPAAHAAIPRPYRRGTRRQRRQRHIHESLTAPTLTTATRRGAC